jgi:YHS domain-containing protein
MPASNILRTASKDEEKQPLTSSRYPYQTFTSHEELDPSIIMREKDEDKKSFLVRMSFLTLIPIVLVTLFFFRTFSSDAVSSMSVSSTTCVSCPAKASTSYCADKDYPVLGGIDVVGTYNSYDSSVTYQAEGTAGSSDYTETYGGYTFYFANAKNQATFAKNPTKYLPQWGGFCSWGIATEFCPSYPWSDTCLGPSGNWYAWTIVDDGMYFFLKKSVLDTFLENTTYYIETGNTRWKSWFGEETVLSTLCYVDIDD